MHDAHSYKLGCEQGLPVTCTATYATLPSSPHTGESALLEPSPCVQNA